MRDARAGGWLVVTVAAPPATREVAVAALMDLGVGMEERDETLVVYLPGADPSASLQLVQQALHELEDVIITGEWRADKDWSLEWKRGLKPRRVGDRIIVTPSWEQPTATEDDIVLVVDPEMAFGTGEHATTRGCLRLLQYAVRKGDRVLDVGTGSAILAIAAARLGAREVAAVESDEDAIENATDNICRNVVATQVQLFQAFVDDAYLAATQPFDLIVANVLSGVLVPLLPSFHAALPPDSGRLILSGILAVEATDVLRAAELAHFVVEREDREDEWWSVLLLPAYPASARQGPGR